MTALLQFMAKVGGVQKNGLNKGIARVSGHPVDDDMWLVRFGAIQKHVFRSSVMYRV